MQILLSPCESMYLQEGPGLIAVRIVHLQVWRILFWAMAGISVITCVLILTMAVEPRSINKQASSLTYAKLAPLCVGHGHNCLTIMLSILLKYLYSFDIQCLA